MLSVDDAMLDKEIRGETEGRVDTVALLAGEREPDGDLLPLPVRDTVRETQPLTLGVGETDSHRDVEAQAEDVRHAVVVTLSHMESDKEGDVVAHGELLTVTTCVVGRGLKEAVPHSVDETDPDVLMLGESEGLALMLAALDVGRGE